MSTVTSDGSRLSDYCEQYVLPALYERLDRAFPEFGWKRTATGWEGTLPSQPAQVQLDRSTTQTVKQSVSCYQPWGFVTQSGEAQSWLAYVNGGTEPFEASLVTAIRELARVAGVGDTTLDGHFSREEQEATSRRERSRQLFEAFVGYTHHALAGGAGSVAVEYLQNHYGFTAAEVESLPLGYYTTCRDVVDYLTSVGFTQREILEARAMTDPALAGRVVVPWRDRWGNIQSIVAHACLEDIGDQPRRLYLKCGDLSEPFGLNVALQPDCDGCENLVLVEDELSALAFHARGVTNVASFGTPGRIPSAEQWQTLADYGVHSVTLAFHDNASGYRRTRSAIDTAHQAARAPHLFALPHRALSSLRRPHAYLQHNDSEAWQKLVDRRVHAYHFVARTILRTYKRGPWTDERLMETLLSALQFDAEVYTNERELDLDRFFWRVILDATSAYWPAVRYLLPHRKDTLLRNRPGSWSQHRCEEQFRDFEEALRKGEPQRFTNLIWSAACELAAVDWKQAEPVAIAPTKPLRTLRPLPPRRSSPLPLPKAAPAPKPEPKREAPRQETPAPKLPKKKPLPLRARPKPLTYTTLDVRRTAYLLWEEDGRPEGRDEYFWFEAEQLLRRLGAVRVDS